LQLNQPGDTDGQETVIASQSINGVAAGDLYYIAAEVNLPGYSSECFIEMRAGGEILLRRQFSYGQQALCGAFYASGLFGSAAAEFSFAYSCNNDGMDALETWAAFDNVALFIYPTTPTTNPPLVARQLLVNNDFPIDDLSPWVSEREDSGVTLGVVDGRATMEYTTSTSQAGLYQMLTSDVENGQSVRVQIDIYVDITSAGTSCTTHVWSGEEVWVVETIKTEQYSVDVRRELPLGASFIYVYTQCTGPATVAFDNAYLTVNPEMATEPETTSSASTASSTSEPGPSSTSTTADLTTSSSSESATESSTTSSSTVETSSSATPTPSVRATPSCPANDTQTYTNDDGSQFMIVCGQDHVGNNIVGINPVAARNFSSCVDLCMYQGTACVGVSWDERDGNCFLKRKMLPSPYQGFTVDSAIRMTGPALGPLRLA